MGQAPTPERTILSEDLELRKQIAVQAQMEPATAATPLVRAFQFFLVPLIIVAACLGLYGGMSLLMGNQRSPREWLRDIKEGGPNVRPHAALQLAQALRRQEKPDATLAPEVMAIFRSTPPEEDVIRRYLVTCLGYLRDPRACELLLETARIDKNMETRTACIDALGTIKHPATLPDLVKMLDHEDGVIRKYAAFNAGAVAEKAGDRSVLEPLRRRLADPRPDVGWNAAFALAYFLGDPSGTDTLKQMLDRKYLEKAIGGDLNREILVARAMFSACNAAAKLRDRSFLPILRGLALHEPDADVRHAAQKAETELLR